MARAGRLRGDSLGQSPAGGGWEMMGRSLPAPGTLHVILCYPLRWAYTTKAESSQRCRRPARRASSGTAVRPRPGNCRETEYLAPKLWTVEPCAGLGTRGDGPAPCSERLSSLSLRRLLNLLPAPQESTVGEWRAARYLSEAGGSRTKGIGRMLGVSRGEARGEICGGGREDSSW